jgi:hypothetical protein
MPTLSLLIFTIHLKHIFNLLCFLTYTKKKKTITLDVLRIVNTESFEHSSDNIILLNKNLIQITMWMNSYIFTMFFLSIKIILIS